jgi:hypothetical protein
MSSKVTVSNGLINANMSKLLDSIKRINESCTSNDEFD